MGFILLSPAFVQRDGLIFKNHPRQREEEEASHSRRYDGAKSEVYRRTNRQRIKPKKLRFGLIILSGKQTKEKNMVEDWSLLRSPHKF